jgi:hypothetical protein
LDWNLAKTVAETLEASCTSLGILVAGVWTYRRFFQQREPFPRASVLHEVQVVSLNGHRLLHVEATITNTGPTLIPLVYFRTWVQQVRPLQPHLADRLAGQQDLVLGGAQEVAWPLLCKRECSWKQGVAEVEPGESQTLSCDFTIDSSIEVVLLYSYIRNAQKTVRGAEIGWERTTFFRIDQEGVQAMPKERLVPPGEWEIRQMPPRAIPLPFPSDPTPMPQVPPRDEPPPPPPPISSED